MSTTTYTPQADSLAAQVCAFLMRNPDEELTVEDIAAKFDAPPRNIHTQLARALDGGLLVRGKNGDEEYIYTKGPKLKTAAVAASAPAAQQHPIQALPKGAAAAYNTQYAKNLKPKLAGKNKIDYTTLPDFASLPIDTDPTLIQRAQGEGQRIKIDFAPLFTRLGVGHSVVMGDEFFYVVRSRISEWHKTHDERLTLKLLDNKKIRVGRVS